MIDPLEVSTIRTGQLPSAAFSLTDNIPHEVGVDLKRGTIQELSDFISAYIGAGSGVGFRAVTVTDGQTLPTTTQQEFILVGKGTFYNVAGGTTLVLTEELNAIVSNGSFWFIGVEIPIEVQLSVTQEIRSGFTDTSPSENAVFNALATKADIGSTGFTDFYLHNFVSAANTFEVPVNVRVLSVHVDSGFRKPTAQWTQVDTTIAFIGTSTIGKRIDLMGLI